MFVSGWNGASCKWAFPFYLRFSVSRKFVFLMGLGWSSATFVVSTGVEMWGCHTIDKQHIRLVKRLEEEKDNLSYISISSVLILSLPKQSKQRDLAWRLFYKLFSNFKIDGAMKFLSKQVAQEGKVLFPAKKYPSTYSYFPWARIISCEVDTSLLIWVKNL